MAKDGVELDFEKMCQICTDPIENFASLGVDTVTKGKHMVYIDNGSNVLAVAHLDSVPETTHFHVIDIEDDDWVFSGQVDDRLGVYVLLDLLPRLDVNVDILLTDDEETGKSTAQFFKTDKKYNWMVQFDRKGEDVAHYMYGSPRLKKRLEKAGFKGIQYGQASDICKLQHLGCEGFNVAIGYQEEHTSWARANMSVLIRQMNRFVKFFGRYENTQFPYEKIEPKPYEYSYTPPANPQNHWQRAWKPVEKVYTDVVCIVCKTNRVETTSVYKNICGTCTKTHSVCETCNEVKPDTKIDLVSGLCLACIESWKAGTLEERLTHLTCLCGKRLFVHEIIENDSLCDACKQAENFKGHWSM